MIAYTIYPWDARVRREAETIASRHGFQVIFLALNEGSNPRVYSKNGVAVHEIGIQKYQGKSKLRYIFSYLRFLLAAFLSVNRLLLSKRLDIVHIHNMPNFLVFAALLARLTGKRTVLDIHDSIPETYLAKFSGSRRPLLFKLLCCEEMVCCFMAHKVICVNHVQKDALAARGLDPDKILVSMNVPDPAIFREGGRSSSINENKNAFRLVYHGTVTRRLGIDLAIQAVAVLNATIPQLELNVLGTGDDLEGFAELSKDLGIEDKVHFNRKMVPLEKMVDLIRGMDVGVISNRENSATRLMLPVKMLEYMVLGIPVVAPRLKAIQYYFDETMVCFYEPENVASLVIAMRSLYLEKDRRQLQVQAAGRFFETYGWEKHKEGLINLYECLRYRA